MNKNRVLQIVLQIVLIIKTTQMYYRERAKSELFIHMGPSHRSAQVFERFSYDEQDPPTINANRSWISSLFLRKKKKPTNYRWVKTKFMNMKHWYDCSEGHSLLILVF
jgi:hypothetical protein